VPARLSARERQKTVRRTTHGREEAARRGRYVAAAPFGYRRAPGGGALERDHMLIRIVEQTRRRLADSPIENAGRLSMRSWTGHRGGRSDDGGPRLPAGAGPWGRPGIPADGLRANLGFW